MSGPDAETKLFLLTSKVHCAFIIVWTRFPGLKDCKQNDKQGNLKLLCNLDSVIVPTKQLAGAARLQYIRLIPYRIAY